MANEYLQRTPTSTGNRRVFTWSGWLKLNSLSTSYTSIMEAFTGSTDVYCTIAINSNAIIIVQDNGAGGVMQITASPLHRDPSSWFHLLVSVDTTQTLAQNRVRIYVNGDEEVVTYTTTPSINFETHFNRTGGHRIGTRWNTSSYINAEYTDIFLVDGQALTPDVFGFYKQGKGYISAGSTQATDFRPGQWVPKTPRVIKTEINRRGGFGVNGFYLPMNDSRNFGADFHGDPNSIITLNEKLPQPRVGVATTASVGLGYTDALRADPYAANLVLALPFVSGGLSSGFGDYAPSIKGSGTAKTGTLVGNVSIANTAGYYGSAANFDKVDDRITFSSSDFDFGTGDFTVEFWFNSRDVSSATQRGFLQTSDTAGGLKTSYTSGIAIIQGSNPSAGSNGGIIAVVGSTFTGAFGTGAILSTNQWNHCALVRKTGTSTLYVNGVAVGVNTTTTGAVSGTNLVVGGYYDTTYLYDGYIQDLRVYKGVAKYTGGFDVPRPYTPVGIATWRQVPDTTANNFATMNPLIEARPSAGTDSPASSTIVTFAGGNLDLTNSASSGNAQRMVSFATIGISTGRWYWEVRAGTNDLVGISKGFQQKNYAISALGSGSGLEASVSYEASGAVSFANTAFGSATTLTPPSFDTTNIIGVALSANNGLNNLTIQFFKDGVGVTTLTGVGATSPVLEWFPSKMMQSSGSGSDQKFNFGQNPTFSGNTTAGTFTDSNGKGLFKYQPPSGFLALCEDNLPTPTISDPSKYFRSVLWTGDGNSGRSIVGVGFTPDLVWIKSRSPSAYNHRAFDSVRGAGRDNFLMPNSTAAEGASSDYYGGISSFNSDGFSMVYGTGGSNIGINESGTNYVAWCWRAGAGTTSTNTNGSITSVVSVNQDAGFSIVSWTAADPTGDNTLGHGLGKVPKFIICKSRTSGTDHWVCYHSALGINNYILLSSTNASGSSANYWSSSNPSSTVFGVANSTSTSNNVGNMIAYCWAEIEGFSKAFSYTGNGSTNGPLIYLGLKPALIIIKRTDNVGNWQIYDSSRMSTNPNNGVLFPNLTNIEGTGSAYDIDFLSNGFKLRSTDTDRNANGSTYIGFAWAESPFTTANAK